MSKKRFVLVVLLGILIFSLFVNAEETSFLINDKNNLVITDSKSSQAGKYGTIYKTNNLEVTRSSFTEGITIGGKDKNNPFQILIAPDLLKKTGALDKVRLIEEDGKKFLEITQKESRKNEPLKIQITPNQIINLEGKKELELEIRNRFVENGKLQGESKLSFNQEALEKIYSINFGSDQGTEYFSLESGRLASPAQIEFDEFQKTTVLYPLLKNSDANIKLIGSNVLVSYESNIKQSVDVVSSGRSIKAKKERVVSNEKVLLNKDMLVILEKIKSLNSGLVPDNYKELLKRSQYAKTLDFMIKGSSAIIGTGIGDLNQKLQKDLNDFLENDIEGSFAFHRNVADEKLILQIDNIENTRVKRYLWGNNVGETLTVHKSKLTSEEFSAMVRGLNDNAEELKEEIVPFEIGSPETPQLKTREIIEPQPPQPKKDYDFGETIFQDAYRKIKALTASEKAKNQAEEDKRRNIGLIAINQYFDRVTEGAYNFDFENNRFTIPVVDLGQRDVKEVLKSKNIQIMEGEELRVTHIYNTQKWGLEIKKKDGTKQEINIPEEKINEYSDLRFGMK